MSVERAREQLELAEGRWERAIAEHAQPPPDPVAFARRLRALADAAAQEQAAYRYAANEGFGWRPGPPWLPPRELRPAPWREALAPPEPVVSRRSASAAKTGRCALSARTSSNGSMRRGPAGRRDADTAMARRAGHGAPSTSGRAGQLSFRDSNRSCRPGRQRARLPARAIASSVATAPAASTWRSRCP